ncbi:universal stress protein [Pedobacter sp. P351]|uniref:universal stress protein n=1 Tax=Pedobacter superstes TaxID=3133441 RepID=UPI003099AB46
MKKILVPIDFSRGARAASEYAASLARIFMGEIYLVYVFTEPIAVIEGTAVAWPVKGGESQEKNDALVENEINYLKDTYGVNVEGYALIGSRTDTINDLINEISADLVVMGTGNTALSIIRKIKTPVLLVPENASFVPVKHIVLAADFNEVTNIECFNLLLEFAGKIDAMLQVLHVKRQHDEDQPDSPGKQQLHDVLSKITYWYQEVEAESVEQGIGNFIESHPAELLVMVAHSHNVFERIFGTVHTSSMIYETKLPLLVLEDK